MTDCVAGRFVACDDEQDEEAAELLAGNALSIDNGVHQFAGDVVLPIGEPILTERLGIGVDRHTVFEQRVERAAHLWVANAEDHVCPLQDLREVTLRNPHHLADDFEG